MKKIMLPIALLLLWAGQAWAVNILQVGVPLDDDGYVDYTTIGTDEDTAFTSGDTLAVAGLYANKSVVSLGGQFVGEDPDGDILTGVDWTYFGLPAAFAGKGAILVATVPELQAEDPVLPGSVKIDLGEGSGWEGPFFYSADESYFPNNHAPTNDPASAYFFFDIGEFFDDEPIPDFADETLGEKLGSIKELTLLITDFDWVHFDVMALQTEMTEDKKLETWVTSTSLANNPGSHDVTWIYEEEDDGGGGEGNPVPEPGTLVLVGAGLVGLALLRRKQNK